MRFLVKTVGMLPSVYAFLRPVELRGLYQSPSYLTKIALDFRNFLPSLKGSCGSPVFLLAKKLTLGQPGFDKNLIWHIKNIEPMIRTFRSGWKTARRSKTTLKSCSCPLLAPERWRRRELRSRVSSTDR